MGENTFFGHPSESGVVIWGVCEVSASFCAVVQVDTTEVRCTPHYLYPVIAMNFSENQESEKVILWAVVTYQHYLIIKLFQKFFFFCFAVFLAQNYLQMHWFLQCSIFLQASISTGLVFCLTSSWHVTLIIVDCYFLLGLQDATL